MSLARFLRPVVERAAPTWEAHEWLGLTGGWDVSNPTSLGLNGALSLPTYWRGAQIRSGIISSLPLEAVTGPRQRPRALSGVQPPIIAQPDPTETVQVTLSRMATSMVTRGEFVAVLGDWDGAGFPNTLKVVDPTVASLQPDGTWTINSVGYQRDEVMHGVPFMLPGDTRGQSTVELFKRVLAGELAALEYHRRFYFDGGGAPPVVVTIDDQTITPQELVKYQDTWADKIAGRRKPAFVPGNTKVTPLFISNRDAQWLEGRQFSIVDIANIVGLPPYYLGAPGSSTVYSNVSEQRRDLIDVYMRPDLYCIELAFTGVLPEGIRASFDYVDFLRLDPKSDAETMTLKNNVMMIDEIRAHYGLRPLPDGRGQVLASMVAPGAPSSSNATEGGDDSGDSSADASEGRQVGASGNGRA